jgi:hypothetical protein
VNSAPNAIHASLLDAPVNASCGPLACAATVLDAPAPPPAAGAVVGVVTGAAAVTITVPCMVEWTRQWYVKVPAVEKTCEYELPGLIQAPVGQLGLESNAPESDVTLWITEPVLVQVTVVPAVTVIDAGEKPKSTIDT